MTRCALALLLCLGTAGASAQTLAERARRDDAFLVDAQDAAMRQAYAQAAATMDAFLRDALAPAPRNSGHAAKVRVRDGEHTEYFWVVDLARSGDDYQGVLNNQPRLVRTVRFGQTIAFKRADMVDWLYTDPSGQMQGSFTTCVLLAREKPEEARALAAQLKLHCG